MAVAEWQTTNVLRTITTVIIREFPDNKDVDNSRNVGLFTV